MIRQDKMREVIERVVNVLNNEKSEESATRAEDMTALIQVMAHNFHIKGDSTDPGSPEYGVMETRIIEALSKVITQYEISATDTIVILLSFIQLVIQVLVDDNTPEMLETDTVH